MWVVLGDCDLYPICTGAWISPAVRARLPGVDGIPGRDLAEVFADIARQLQAGSSPDKVLDRVTLAAVDTVEGCGHAAISIVSRRGRIETVAATDDVPPVVDAIQYEVGQGPCLDAIDEHEIFLIDDLAIDERWPAFGSRAAAETGVHSMLSFRLSVRDDTIGALNLYSRQVGAFTEQARAVGAILATHAALAVEAARDKERVEHLDQALVTSRQIGAAIGVLMARNLMTQDEAFELLRRASQHLNRKLRDVAADVLDTGQLPVRRRSQAGE
jgi:GAF domain-containing protein